MADLPTGVKQKGKQAVRNVDAGENDSDSDLEQPKPEDMGLFIQSKHAAPMPEQTTMRNINGFILSKIESFIACRSPDDPAGDKLHEWLQRISPPLQMDARGDAPGMVRVPMSDADFDIFEDLAADLPGRFPDVMQKQNSELDARVDEIATRLHQGLSAHTPSLSHAAIKALVWRLRRCHNTEAGLSTSTQALLSASQQNDRRHALGHPEQERNPQIAPSRETKSAGSSNRKTRSRQKSSEAISPAISSGSEGDMDSDDDLPLFTCENCKVQNMSFARHPDNDQVCFRCGPNT